MNKKIFAITSSITLLLLSPAMAFALPQNVGTIEDVKNRIFNFIWPIFIAFAIIMFIVAGFLFLTANGEGAKVKQAREAMLWGVVGIVVGILAFSIPYIIGTTLGTGV